MQMCKLTHILAGMCFSRPFREKFRVAHQVCNRSPRALERSPGSASSALPGTTALPWASPQGGDPPVNATGNYCFSREVSLQKPTSVRH